MGRNMGACVQPQGLGELVEKYEADHRGNLRMPRVGKIARSIETQSDEVVSCGDDEDDDDEVGDHTDEQPDDEPELQLGSLPQAELPSLRFRPRPGVDYLAALLQKVKQDNGGLEGLGVRLQPIIDAHSRRPICIRTDVDAREWNLTDAPKRDAALLFAKGVMHKRKPCQRCENGLGPSPGCVSLGGVFKGACANCAFTGAGRKCNCHVNRAFTISFHDVC